MTLGAGCGLGACGSFAETSISSGDAGGEEAAPAPDAEVDASPSPDASNVSDAADSSDASDGSACPGKDLTVDRDNCGACGRKCGAYSALCLGGECEHLVFVTHAAVPANLGGLAGADAQCTALAHSSGSADPSAPFKAWLSTSGLNAAARLHHGQRRYLDKQGITVAANWDGLVSSALAHGITFSEAGQSVAGAHVRTATTPFGLFAGTTDCAGWTSASGALMNSFGLAGSVDGVWSLTGTEESCSVSARLYCIEQ